MANIVRYVNTASTAGGNGTTNATTGANRAYASLNEWEAGEQTDLVTATDTHELFCTGTAIDSATTTILGWTTSALYDITIHGETSSTSWDATKYGMSTGDTNGVIVNEDFVTFNNFQVETSIVNSSIETFTTSATGASAEIVLNSCYIRNTTSATGSQQYFRGVFCGTGTTTLNNCVVTGYRRGSNPGHAVRAYDTASILLYNSVINNSYRALDSTSTGSFTAINCVLNANYPIDSGTVTTDYCASASVITGGGANNILITSYGDEVVSLTNNAEDIRLRADSQLIGAGVGYDSDSLVPLTDISGKTRLTSVSDIGASYYTPIKHFVNTGSTAGGTGLTNATTGTDRAYASASEWEAAEATDLTASFDIQEVYMSGVVADTALTILGRTTSAAYKLRVFGDNDTGIYSASYYRTQGNGDDFVVLEDYVDLNRIQTLRNASGGYDGITYNAAGVCNAIDCISYDTSTAFHQYLTGIVNKGSGTLNSHNCQVIGWKGSGGGECVGIGNFSTGTHNFYNGIIDDCDNSFYEASGSLVVKNTAHNSTTVTFSGTPTIDYCANTSGAGTNSVTITTWANEFVDSANHDYHLVASGALEGQGVGPSTDAVVHSPDVDGDARSGTTCDIGIDEYVVGGAASYSITGATTVSTVIASTLAFALNAAITGATAITPAIASTMAFTPGSTAYAIVGDTSVTQIIEAGLVSNQHSSINGDTSVATTIVADLLFNRHASILGDTTVSQTIAANFTHNTGNNIVGSTTVNQVISSSLVINRNPTIDGNVTITPVINSTLAANEHSSILGATDITPSIAAGMQYLSGNAIIGSVSVQTTIDALKDFTQHASLIGDTTVNTTVAANMDFAGLVYGDVYNAVEAFPTASSVTIEIFDPVTGATVAITSNVCREMPTTGIYIWDTTKLTTQPTGYKEYVWKMTDGITVKGGIINMMDADTIATAVWQATGRDTKYIELGVWIDTELVAVGDGSQSAPFNDLTLAIDYAETYGVKTLHVYSDIIVDRQLKNFKVIGVGNPVIDCNGQNLNKSEFVHCKMEGAYIGEITVQQSLLLNNFWLSGYFENCGLAGNLFCVDGATVFMKDSASAIAGLSRPTISMSATSYNKLSVRANKGGMTIRNCNNALDEVTVEVSEGSLTFDNTNNLQFDGQMVARGHGIFVDETIGFVVRNEMQSKVIWEETLEGTYTAEQVMRLLSSVLAGEVSGMDTLNPVFMDISNTKPRIAATTDKNGNRTSVILDAE